MDQSLEQDQEPCLKGQNKALDECREESIKTTSLNQRTEGVQHEASRATQKDEKISNEPTLEYGYEIPRQGVSESRDSSTQTTSVHQQASGVTQEEHRMLQLEKNFFQSKLQEKEAAFTAISIEFAVIKKQRENDEILIKEFNEKIENEKKQREQLQQEKDEFKTKLEKEKDDHSATMKKLEAKKRKAEQKEKELGELKADLNLKENEVVKFRTIVEEKTTRMGELKSEVERKNIQLRELRSEGEMKDTQLRELWSEGERKDSQLRELRSEGERKDSQLGELKSEVERKDNELGDLRSEVERKNIQLESEIQRKNILSLISKVEQTNTKLDKLITQETNLQSVVNAHEVSQTQNAATIESLKRKVCNLKTMVAELSNRHDELAEKLEQQGVQPENTANDNTGLSLLIAEFERIINDMERETETETETLPLQDTMSVHEVVEKRMESEISIDPNLKSEKLSSLMKLPSRTRPDLAKKLITTDGGTIKTADVILRIDAGCLAKDTEITLRVDDQHVDLKSLFELDLIQGASNVVEFLPNGLKFLKPADILFRHEKTVSDNELLFLRGSYNCNCRRTIWEPMASDIKENTKEGFVAVKIEGFSFYLFLLAKRGVLARVLSHLNYSFTCFSYALCRRDNELIDILIVLVSEFVDEEKDIKQLNCLYEEGYFKSEKGLGKRVKTDRCLQMCLDFPEYKGGIFSFEVDQPQLDSIGFVVDHFKGISIKYPVKENVKICEVHSEENSTAENEILWVLKIDETKERAIKTKSCVPPPPPPPPQLKDLDLEDGSTEPKVIRRNTKLTRVEITRVSRMVAMDWDSLAGLMNIPYEEREEIRTNYAKYPDSPSKAEEVLNHFNGSDCFGRDIFGKCVDELGRHDLIKKLHLMEDEEEEALGDKWKEKTALEINGVTNEEIPPESQPLSPREMYRLSRRIAVDWDSLAGLMDIAKEERDDIRRNIRIYHDNRSQAEKILSIFNRRRDFSRKKLIECLKELKKIDIIRPIVTGEWKDL